MVRTGTSKRSPKFTPLSLLAILLLSTFASLLLTEGASLSQANGAGQVTPASSTSSTINLKALLINCRADFYSPPYNQQTSENMMRDWGIPFDSIVIGDVTASTFWDSADQVSKYQFVVYFGCSDFQSESTLSSAAVGAVDSAVSNGTNFIFVGAGVENWASLFGLSDLSDCPTDPEGGGTCGGALTFGVTQNWCGVLRDDACWSKGEQYTVPGIPDYAMPKAAWDGTVGTLFMNATAEGTIQPNVIYRNYGPHHAQIWWYGATEGPFSFYRQGWAGTFDNGVYSTAQYHDAFEPEVELFYYALNNVTAYDVQMMPWATQGSAEVIRAEDHDSLCPAFTECATTGSDPIVAGLQSRGLVGEINLNLNGWSNSVPIGLTPGLPSGSSNSPCPTGYTYSGQLDAVWKSRDFLVCPIESNSTATSNGGTSDKITTSHSVDLPIVDGNTTTIDKIEVLVTASESPSWTLTFTDSRGKALWTSTPQTTPLRSATWVKFNDINFTGGTTGYVNDVQGNDRLTLKVTSGTVNWFNQTSRHADWVVQGRSNWDIMYIDPSGTDNFAGAKPLVPDSIRMASGALYPGENATYYISGIPGLIHPADIKHEVDTGAPAAVNVETFFNMTDWTIYGGSQQRDWSALAAEGWQLDTNGWTHAKVASGGSDNDFVLGNGTRGSGAFITQRIDDIDSRLNQILPGLYTQDWAFGTSAQTFYPAESQMAAAGYSYAQLATENLATSAYVTAGYVRTSASGGGSIYDVGQGYKGTGVETWFGTYNETRDTMGVIETHSDMVQPWNDYDMAEGAGLTQKYDLSSTWFCGTTVRCFSFWNTTFFALQNVKTFQWKASTDNITLVAYTGTSSSINNAKFGDPMVFRLPESFQGRGLTATHDNKKAGSLANSTDLWSYYQINTGKGWTDMQFNYHSASATVTVATSPGALASSLTIDSQIYSSPATFTWLLNSRHTISAAPTVSCGDLCQFRFNSWSNGGSISQLYTVSGPTTVTAAYSERSLIPAGVIDYIPITLTNAQVTPVVIGTQERLVIDWNDYNSLLNPAISNVGFFDSNGVGMASWNENASSSTQRGVVWTKMTVGIPADGGTATIFLGFYTTSLSRYSPTGLWGEAPQLSATYAQYDNGPRVFDYYQDFNGSTLPSGWTNGGCTVSDGLTIPANTNYCYSGRTFGDNATQALDFFGTLPTPNVKNAWSCFGYIAPNGGSTCQVTSGRTLVAWATEYGHQTSDSFGIATVPGNGALYDDAQDTTGKHIYQIYWPGGSSYSVGRDYGPMTSVGPSGAIPISAMSLGGASSANSNYNQTEGPFIWIRLRVEPPDGSFPSQGLGAVIGATVTQPITLTAKEAGAPDAIFTLDSACGPSPSKVAGDGLTHDVKIAEQCQFAIYAVNSGATRAGFISGSSFTNTSGLESTCFSGTCSGISLSYDVQNQLTIVGGISTSQSAPSETGDGFYKYGDRLSVFSNGVGPRSAGTGMRVSSWRIDGGAANSVATSGTVTTSILIMTAPHTVTFVMSTQHRLTVAVSPAGAGTAAATTSPAIPGDTGWYDSGAAVSISATPTVSYVFGTWSSSAQGIKFASASSASTTATLGATGTITAAFSKQGGALSLDGNASGQANLGTTVSVSLTTSCSPDVIVVLIGEDTARADATAAAPTSSGLSFALRTSLQSGTMRTWEYYSVATDRLTTQTITEVTSGQTAYTMTAFGVCGANTAAPFDTSPSLPKATGGFWGTSHSNKVTTSGANDLIFDLDASQGNPSYTPLNGYTPVLTQQVPSWMASSLEYKVLSEQQSGSALGFTLTVGQSGSQIVDAIVAAPAPPSLPAAASSLPSIGSPSQTTRQEVHALLVSERDARSVRGSPVSIPD